MRITEPRYSLISAVAMVVVTAIVTFLNCRPFCGGLCVDWGFPIWFLRRTDVIINGEWSFLHQWWALLADLVVAAAFVFGAGSLCERITKMRGRRTTAR